MFRSRKRVAAIGIAALGFASAVTALLQWWAVALALLAIVNSVGIALLLRGVAHQQELRRLDKGIRDVEKRLEKVAARVVATGEATRVDIIDRLGDRG